MTEPVRHHARAGSGRTRDAATDFARHLQRARADNAPSTKSREAGRGDSFGSIARDEGLSMEELYRANPSFDPRRQDGFAHFDRGRPGTWDTDALLPGDVINLPIPSQEQGRRPATSTEQPDATPPGGNGPALGMPATPPVASSPSPAPTATPSGAPQQPQAGPGWTALAYPVVRALIPERAGLGVENTWNRKGNVTLEPYAKSFWQGPHGVGLALKVKWTPRANVAELSRPQGQSGIQAIFGKDAKGNRNPRGLLPQRISVDAGLVFARNHEVGRTFEFGRKSLKPTGTFSYYSAKNKNDPLVSTTQLKFGKAQGGELVRGLMSSLRTRQKDFWPTMRSMEVQVSSEWKPVSADIGGVPASGLVTVTGKATVGEVVDKTAEVLKAPPPTTTSRFGRASGFTAGTLASLGGDALARRLGSDKIQNTAVRNAVNASAAATTGIATDYAVTRGVSKLGPKLGQVARTSGLTKAAAPLANAASKVSWGGVGRVATKAGRIGGPAGALLAGIPDGIDAYKSFKAGDTGAGIASTAKAGVKVGTTLAGAAIGQALIPIPGVGAAVGAVAGGLVGDALTSDTAVKAYTAVGDGIADAGKAVADGAGKAAKWVGGLFH